MNMRRILQKGLTTVEYVIVVSAVAAIVVGAFHLLGNTMSDNINDLSGAVDGKGVASTTGGASPAASGSAPNPFNSGSLPAAGAAGAEGTNNSGAPGGSFSGSSASTSTGEQDNSSSQGGTGTGEYTDTESSSSTPTTTSQSAALSAGVTNSIYDGSRNGSGGINVSTSLPSDDSGVAVDQISGIQGGDIYGFGTGIDGTVTFTITDIEIISPPTLAQLTTPVTPLVNQAAKKVKKDKDAEKESVTLGWPFWFALSILFPFFWLLLSRMFRGNEKRKPQHIPIG